MTLAARDNSAPTLPSPASGGGLGRGPSRFAIPLRFALRDLRGGLRGFYVFIACIALGVMAIAGVNSFASSLGDGLAREGRTILGGDLSFTLIHREADAAERAFLDRAGRVSAAATMRAMARTGDGRTALVEVKAVDAAYPLFGAARSIPRCRSPMRSPRATACSAPPSIRCCWRGSTSSPARASPLAPRPSKSAPRSPPSPTACRPAASVSDRG